MEVASAPPQVVLTNISDVEITPNIDVTKTTATTEPPVVNSGASVIPPPPPPPTSTDDAASITITTTTTTVAASSTTTTMKDPLGTGKATIPTTAPKTTSTTESLSTALTTTTIADSSQIQCPDLFLASNEDFKGNDGQIKADHHHTIIINNKNKAIVFDHKTKDKNRGDDDGSGERSTVDDKQSSSSSSSAGMNSGERTPGAIVTAICSHGTVPLTVTFLECQPNGKWNGTLPHCHGPMDVSSNTLYFSVIGGVCGLTILILVFIYLVMMKTRRRDKGPASPPLDPDKALYVDPYAVGERLYSIPAPLHYTRGDITYAKPQIYGTYLNPSFYEDAYQRWRRQEQQVSEKLYDSPFINSSQQWGDTQDPTWTLNRGDKKVEQLHIPRAKISPMDQGSVRSHDSVSTMTFTGPRPQRVLYGRSASVVSTNATMPRYSNGHFSRRQSNLLEPHAGLHLVKAFEDVPPQTLQEMEAENFHDGRTPF